MLLKTRYWLFPLLLIGATVLIIEPAWAGVSDATMQVSGAYRTMKALGKAVGFICAFIGSVKVYNKFQMGDPDVYRSILVWVFALLFCVFFPYVIDTLYR